MLSYPEALARLLKKIPEPTVIQVPLLESLYKVLASPVPADLDLPPFDRSCMDGYALRQADLATIPASLEVVGVVAAGHSSPPQLNSGQAFQIMTGAPVPPGADAVQRVEKTRRSGTRVDILEAVSLGENISRRGTEVRHGSVVLASGRVIGPPEIAVLATFGATAVPVFKSPSVAIVSTGNELVDIDQTPDCGQIRNSNASMLWAQCSAAGLDASILPPVIDDRKLIREAVAHGLEKDLLILSGGVSMGEFDYVHRVLREEGVEVFFHKVAIKPGKPLIVGRRGNHMVFGLPGNPVSSFVTFEVFVKPAVRKWMGFTELFPPMVRGRLALDARKKSGRLFFKPARTVSTPRGFSVQPLETKGSADLVAFSGADSLMLFPAEADFLPAGSGVDVVLMESRGGPHCRGFPIQPE
ncbi:MAG: gephyrin-like molybdotransferase Glp [Acidobacteriota bacterium]